MMHAVNRSRRGTQRWHGRDVPLQDARLAPGEIAIWRFDRRSSRVGSIPGALMGSGSDGHFGFSSQNAHETQSDSNCIKALCVSAAAAICIWHGRDRLSNLAADVCAAAVRFRMGRSRGRAAAVVPTGRSGLELDGRFCEFKVVDQTASMGWQATRVRDRIRKIHIRR